MRDKAAISETSLNYVKGTAAFSNPYLLRSDVGMAKSRRYSRLKAGNGYAI